MTVLPGAAAAHGTGSKWRNQQQQWQALACWLCPTALEVYAEQGAALGEEARLGAAAADHVKVAQPGVALGGARLAVNQEVLLWAGRGVWGAGGRNTHTHR